jgi:hypothetical protein
MRQRYVMLRRCCRRTANNAANMPVHTRAYAAGSGIAIPEIVNAPLLIAEFVVAPACTAGNVAVYENWTG